jgi:hypothetical protein
MAADIADTGANLPNNLARQGTTAYVGGAVIVGAGNVD